MGYDIKLKVFTLRLKKFRKRKDNELMWSEVFDLFEGNANKKFNAFFKRYLESFDGKFVRYKNWPKAIMIPELKVHFKSKDRLFYGQFDGGPTNQTFTVKKMNDPTEHIVIDKDQVTSSPFYFIFYLPSDSNVGLLIVQSLGDHSMHDVLKLNFQLFVRSLDETFMVDYKEKITKDAVESYKKGSIKSVSIRKSGLSKDDGDNIFVKKYQDYGNIKIELKVTFLDKLVNAKIVNDIKASVLGQDPQIFEVETLESLGMDEDADIFAKFDYNGKQSIAKVENGVKLSPTYIVDSEDVPLDADNHPNADKMKKYLIDFMKKMKAEIGL